MTTNHLASFETLFSTVNFKRRYLYSNLSIVPFNLVHVYVVRWSSSAGSIFRTTSDKIDAVEAVIIKVSGEWWTELAGKKDFVRELDVCSGACALTGFGTVDAKSIRAIKSKDLLCRIFPVVNSILKPHLSYLVSLVLADSQRRELYSVWASAKVGSRKPAYLGQLTLVQRCEYFFEMIGAIASCSCNDYSHHVASVFC